MDMEQKELSDWIDLTIKIMGDLHEAESALHDARSGIEALSREIQKEYNKGG